MCDHRGPHRYLVVVMSQDGGRIGVKEEAYAGATSCQNTGRENFRLEEFRSKYGLGEVIAANYFQVDFDASFAPTCNKNELPSVLA